MEPSTPLKEPLGREPEAGPHPQSPDLVKISDSALASLADAELIAAAPSLTPEQVGKLTGDQLTDTIPFLSYGQLEPSLPSLDPADVACMTPAQLDMAQMTLTGRQLYDVLGRLTAPQVAAGLDKFSLEQLRKFRADQLEEAIPLLSPEQMEYAGPKLAGNQVARLTPRQFNNFLPYMDSSVLERSMHEMTLPQLSKITTKMLEDTSVKKLTGKRLAAILPALPRSGAGRLSASQLAELTPEQLALFKQEQVLEIKPRSFVMLDNKQLHALNRSPDDIRRDNLKKGLGAAAALLFLRKILRPSAPNGWFRDKRVRKWCYSVRSGDTLIGITKRFHGNWERIYSQNRRIVTDPSLIYPGQRLYVDKF